MSSLVARPRDTFLELRMGWMRRPAEDKPDRDAVERLRAAAARWSASSSHLYAGWALEEGISVCVG
jgi:hypothetical protein